MYGDSSRPRTSDSGKRDLGLGIDAGAPGIDLRGRDRMSAAEVINQHAPPTRESFQPACHGRVTALSPIGRLTPIKIETLTQAAHGALTAPTEPSQRTPGQSRSLL